MQRYDQCHADQAVPIAGRFREGRCAAVQEIQREMGVAGKRTFAADLGEVRRLGARAFDVLLTGSKGTGPYPPGVPLPDANARQPLAVAVRVEIRAAHVRLPALVLSPAQLCSDSVFRQCVPDQTPAEVDSIVAVGERLRGDEPDGGKTIAQSLLGSKSPQRIGDSAVERSLRFDEPAGGDELHTGSRRRAQAPCGIADGTCMAGDWDDSGL